MIRLSPLGRCLILCLIALAAVVPPVRASVPHNEPLTVTTTLDLTDTNPGDGICAAQGAGCSLRAAIQESNALAGKQTILVPTGIYTLTIAGANEDLGASGDLDITDPVLLLGDGRSTTIIDAADLDRVLSVLTSSTAVPTSISGLTLRNGQLDHALDERGKGGAVLISGGSIATLNDSMVRDSTSSSGAGIYVGGELNLIHSTVMNNRANEVFGDGGGILMLNDTAALTITGSMIASNRASSGGGIFKQGGTLEIESSLITLNRVSQLGGGLLNNAGGPVLIINSTFSGNIAGTGSAIVNDGFSRTTLMNSTITANSDPEGVSAVIDAHSSTDEMLLSYNTIIAGNDGGDCTGPLRSLGHTIIGTLENCIYDDGPGDKTTIDPKLGPLAANGGPTLTHALLPGSPAINAGNSTSCPTTDQRGFVRDMRCDIGAYEAADAGEADGTAVFLPLTPR